MLTLKDSPEEATFRAEVAAFTATVPAELRWTSDHASLLEVDRLMSEAHLLGVSWPVEYGGRGAPPAIDAILTEELGRAGIKRAASPSHQGMNNLAAGLMNFGTEEQKKRYLPEILGVREIWCQGFSEPDAGSDLASVRTRAVRDGDSYVVDGSKTWTSGAHHADLMYALVRTGEQADRHRALTFLVFPVSTPGVRISPIRNITGGSEFNDVYLDDVVVPAENLIGEEGDGWKVAMAVLASERLSGRFRHATFQREVRYVAGDLAQLDEVGEHSLTELGAAFLKIEGIGAMSLRVDSMRAAGVDTSALSSVNKVWWPREHQQFLDVALRLASRHRLDPARTTELWLDARPESIYGGSAQIQRNLIAERHLGLPRR